MTRVRCFIFACVLSLAAGCDNNTTTPTPIDPTIFTEVFSGTINQNGAASHPFVSQSSGIVVATLTSVTPDATQVVGVSLGTWTGSTCQIVIANDKATQSSQLQGSVGLAGLLCARVDDSSGTIPSGSPVTYELTVRHP